MVPYVAIDSLKKLEKPYVSICCYMRPYTAMCTHVSYVIGINLK